MDVTYEKWRFYMVLPEKIEVCKAIHQVWAYIITWKDEKRNQQKWGLKQPHTGYDVDRSLDIKND